MNKRILILDDDRALLDMMQEMLAYEGFETLTVENAGDLLDLVRRYQPALVLLDFGLNGVDGGVLCSRLKGSPEFAAIPVIIFTAYANKGIEKGSYGCDDFIAKPFDLDDITGRIRTLTGNERVEPAI